MAGTREQLREAGRKGMRARWGPPRVLRLDELRRSDPVAAEIIDTILAARRNAAAPPAGKD